MTSLQLSLKFKSLDNTVHECIVDKTDIINTKLDEIKSLFGYNDDDVNLIYSGKILDLTKSFDFYKINDRNVIIIMKKTRQPVPKQSVPILPVNNIPLVSPSQSRSVPAPRPMFIPQLGQSSSLTQLMQALVQPAAQHTQMLQALFQPAAQHTQGSSIIQFWNTPCPQSERTQSYTLEQIHASIPMFIQYLIRDPSYMLTLLTQPEVASSEIANQRYRNILRQFLEQYNTIIEAYRTNGRANIIITNETTGHTDNISSKEDEELLSNAG